MGIYLNPGNYDFKEILNSDYVDKTGMIDYINNTIDKKSLKLTCFSRPRRFGKTLAAKMLCAYYDKSCDSRELFEQLEISKTPSFEKHLNRYNVIYLDITWFISRIENAESVVSNIQESVIGELRKIFEGCIDFNEKFLPDALGAVYERTGERFFFVIDEWDALFREAKYNVSVQKSYIQFLRSLFKGPVTAKTIAGAYMTGILPIKKYGTESALTDFVEYTMVTPDALTEYVGFTEQEVADLCEMYHMDFDKMKLWYDGYSFEEARSVYSPNSVMSAIHRKRFDNYWTKTETYESLRSYISMNKDGLKEAIVAMLGGLRIEIEPLGFQNDMVNMNTRDDVLTLLVHLGYLAYDSNTREVYIPNLEVAESFKLAVKDSEWKDIGETLERSRTLLKETLACNQREKDLPIWFLFREGIQINLL